MHFLRRTWLLTCLLLSGRASTARANVLSSAAGSPAIWTGAAVGASAVATGCLACLQKVRTGDQCLIERFGVFNRKLGPGPY